MRLASTTLASVPHRPASPRGSLAG